MRVQADTHQLLRRETLPDSLQPPGTTASPIGRLCFKLLDSLSGYVGEDVTIRYDPRDLAQIHVYANDLLVCRATCFELSGKTVSLKDVRQARNHEAKVQRQRLSELLATADKYAPVERPITELCIPLKTATSTTNSRPPVKDFG